MDHANPTTVAEHAKSSNFKELAKQMEGGKPMLLYVVGQSFNLVLTLAMAWLAFSVLFPNAV